MATHVKSVHVLGPDAISFPDLIANQIAEAAAPSIGNILCYVLHDGGTDNGVYVRFSIPPNYVGTPQLRIRGVLDGAPGASEVLGFGVRKRAVADNEAADGSFDAEQTASATIGSSGLSYSDEDFLSILVPLTAADYAVDDDVFAYVFIDASATTYAGNFLLTAVEFVYADV